MRFLLGLACLVALLAATSPTQAQRWLAVPTAKEPLAPGTVYISRVVDARAVRASAELYNPERPQLPRPAAFEAGLAPVLREFFNRYAPAQPVAVPLVLRIIGLDVAEVAGPGVRAGLQADLYALRPDSSYRLVHHLSLLAERSSFLVSQRAAHADNLGTLLLEVAARSRDQASWLAAGPAYPAAFVLNSQPQPAEQLPILNASVQPRPGYYHSPTEFWLNEPSEPGQPDLAARPYTGTEWVGELEIKAYRRGPDGQRAPATDVWGLCDGQDFYLFWGGDFHRLQRQGQEFLFRGRVGQGAVLHTALNVLMVGTIVSGSPVVVTNHGQAEHPVPMRLPVLTGVVAPAAAAGASGLAARPTQLYLYRPQAAKGPPVRVRLAADEPARELAAGDYLSFTLPASQAVQVCLLPASGPETCLPVELTPEATTYLEYQPNQPTPFQPVPAKTGEAALRRLVQ